MDHLLELGKYGRIHITTQVVDVADLVEGDFVYDKRQGYHDKVVKVDEARGPRHIELHWYKWDPAIEMPMREHKWDGTKMNKVVFDEEELLPQEIAKLRHKLDLSRYEKGGPYN